MALFDAKEQHHALVRDAVTAARRPFIIPTGILAEVGYLLESRHEQHAVKTFLEDIVAGVYSLHCGDHDVPRILELVDRYRDFSLGIADANVISCAERHGGNVATLDYRHFRTVEREGTIKVVS